MALHDTDIHSFDRSAPRPNSHDDANAIRHQASGLLGGNHTVPGPPVALGNFRFIYATTAQLVNNGASLGTVQFAHNLSFVPMVQAAINNASVTAATGQVPFSSIFLPTFTAATISGGNVNFNTWLYAFADAQNVYANLANATGNPITVSLTFYLFQQTAVQ